MPRIYRTLVPRLSGSSASELYSKCLVLYKSLARKTKRRPYVRSAYFNNEKIFLDFFWQHLRQKNWSERGRRLRFYPCALDLLKHSQINPITKQNPNHRKELLHRFIGVTSEGHIFYVQVQENLKTDQKSFMSVFPEQ